MLSNCVIEWIEIHPVDSAIHLLNSLRAADVFPVVASLSLKKASAPRRLPFQHLKRGSSQPDLVFITTSQKRTSLLTKTCVSSSRKRAEKPCGMQLQFLRKSNIGQTNVSRFFSSRAPLPWLNSDSFPPRPVIFITSGIINTKFDRRLQPLTVDLSIITYCRSRSYS